MLAEEQLNPRTESRADLRNAMVCTSISNVFGGKAKLEDFMIKFDSCKKQVNSQEEFDGKMAVLQARLNKAKGKK